MVVFFPNVLTETDTSQSSVDRKLARDLLLCTIVLHFSHSVALQPVTNFVTLA